MSFNPKAWEPVRLEYHAARFFTGQNIHGEDKTYDDLKETYQIAILAKEKFFPDKNFAHNFLYYDPDKTLGVKGSRRAARRAKPKVKQKAASLLITQRRGGAKAQRRRGRR